MLLPPEFAEFTADPTPRNLQRARALFEQVWPSEEINTWVSENKDAIRVAAAMFKEAP